MLLIPAIDLKDGQCVRLRQGQMDESKVYSTDPVAVAGQWVEQGTKRLHLVDLDGAFAGKPKNAGVIRQICETFPDVDIQVGGGIRDDDTIDAYLEVGVNYVIIGTSAVNTPHFVGDVCSEFPGHIIVGLDAKNGKVAIDGWSKLSNHDVVDMAQRFERDGVEAIIYTDISRDGMMTGVNVESTVELAQAIHIPVIASGGVSSLDDIRALCEVTDEGIQGAVIGKALYEDKFTYAEAQAVVKEMSAK